MNKMKRVLQRAKKVKLIAMDIDGVLTAGELIVLDSGEEIKIWNIKDRFAYTMLRRCSPDIKLAWITGRESRQVSIRAKELNITYLYQKVNNKLQAFENLVGESKFKLCEIAYIGDDWLDIPVLKRVGLSVCPKDAPREIKKFVHYISEYDGGKGVFREVVEIILKARDTWKKVFEMYNK